MDINSKQWESVLRADPGLQYRLQRLDAQGVPATRKGDLLSLVIEGGTPVIVSWDGTEIQISRRAARKPFLTWTMSEEKFKELFSGKCPPILVAMNNDQKNIKAGADHHNGSLAVSFLVLLQEFMGGGEAA